MDTTALFKLSYGLYVVGVKTERGLGGCIVDTVGQVAAGEKPVVTLACQKKNYTNECIKRAGEFTISVLPANVDPFVIANFGFQSGREVDKWDNVPHAISGGLPLLDNAAAYLRLRVVSSLEFETHTLFICELSDASVGSNQSKPLTYGDYQLSMKGEVGAAFRLYKESGKPPMQQTQWQCSVCGYVYDGETPFERLPETWLCPVCGEGKGVFERVV